ncbi:MAG: hypothetical protein JW795_12690 [Chitinivibrionales bacterium]|nr:hypothetical protein [Chitinivibrionales bacterium]
MRKAIFLVYAFIFPLFLFAEDIGFIMQPIVNVETDFILSVFKENTADIIRSGNEIANSFKIVIGNHLAIGNLSLDISGLAVNDTESNTIPISFQEAQLAYTGESFVAEAGKTKAVWGAGFFFHPLYYIEPLLQAEQFGTERQDFFLWGGSVRFYNGINAINVLGYVDPDFIEKDSSIIDWGTALFQHELFINQLTLRYLIAYLYHGKNYFVGGAEIEWDIGNGFLLTVGIRDMFGGDTKEEIETVPTEELKAVASIMYTVNDLGLSFVLENYFDHHFFSACSINYTPLQGSLFENFSFTLFGIVEFIDFSDLDVTNMQNIAFSLGGGLTHSISSGIRQGIRMNWFFGDDESTIGSDLVPITITYYFTLLL